MLVTNGILTTTFFLLQNNKLLGTLICKFYRKKLYKQFNSNLIVCSQFGTKMKLKNNQNIFAKTYIEE